MTVAIIVPVLRRPHRVVPLLESIEAATPGARVLFVCTPGDDEEIAAIEQAGGDYICTPEVYETGDYAKKTNLGYRATWEPLLFLGADDLHFLPGWLDIATARLIDGIGVVGTNDLCNRRTRRVHSTHSLVTREYADRGTIDQPGQILHEGYHHVFCDDELIATARSRDAYVHADDCKVEHLHPTGRRKVARDAVYDHGISQFEADRAIFEGRQHLWT